LSQLSCQWRTTKGYGAQGLLAKMKVQALAGGVLKLKNPFGNKIFNCSHDQYYGQNGFAFLHTFGGGQIIALKSDTR